MFPVDFKILIVDACEADGEAARHWLERYPAARDRCRTAPTISRALSVCRDFEPDCILLDHSLPDGDGLQLLDRLQTELEPLAHVKIMFSGSGDERLAVSALQHGADDYLPKSMLKTDLLPGLIQQALQTRSLQREKRRTTLERASREKMLGEVVAAAPAIVYAFDVQTGSLLFLSEYAEKALGYRSSEVMAMSRDFLRQLVHPDDLILLSGHFAKLAAETEGATLRCEYRIRHKNGAWRWFSSADSIFERDAAGEARLLAGTATENTEKKQTEMARTAYQQRLQIAEEASGISFWEWSTEAEQARCSPSYFALYGLAPDSRCPTFGEWLLRVHPEDRERARTEVKAALAGALYDTEFRIVWPDGTVHWLSARGTAINERGMATRLIGAHVDITAQKVAEQRLRESNRDLEQFAHMASHDLQEPLRSVVNFSQVLQRRVKHNGELSPLVDYILQGATRMQELIADLLHYASLNAATLLNADRVAIARSLEDAISNLHSAIEESGAVVTSDALPTLVCEPGQVTHVFQNLIGNAIKYRSEQTPQIHVSASQQAGNWTFSVADNGIGIKAEHCHIIFEPFRRLHGRGKYNGTGIGLAICKRVAERHGGRMWVQSEEGAGSTFFFSLAEATSNDNGVAAQAG